MTDLFINTADGDGYWVDPESIKIASRWGRKWLAAMDADGQHSYLIALESIICVEQDLDGEEDE
jgi:hypothetical protein